jgi:MerR family transcriptional regulator, heat shock protein HspR
MTQVPGTPTRLTALDDASYPAYAMSAAAQAIGVTPAFLRSAEAAGLFEAHRSDGGHRRYSREDLQRADRVRQLVDEGIRMDAAVRIVGLEFQLAAAHTMIETLRRKADPPKQGSQRQ